MVLQERATQLTNLANTIAGFAEWFVTKELVATNATFRQLPASSTIWGETSYTLSCIALDGTTLIKSATARVLPAFQEL